MKEPETASQAQWRLKSEQRGQKIYRLQRLVHWYQSKAKRQHKLLKMTQAERIDYEVRKEEYRHKRHWLFEKNAEEVREQVVVFADKEQQAIKQGRPTEAYFWAGAKECLWWLQYKHSHEFTIEEEYKNSQEVQRWFCLGKWARELRVKSRFEGMAVGAFLMAALGGLLILCISH